MPSVAGESEQWVSVSVNEKYLVSNSGKVKSLRTGKILNPSPRVNGYVSVSLSSDSGHKVRYYVHRLVAHAFCGGCPEEMTVNHINFNRSDNRAINLEVVTTRQNIGHSHAAGHYANAGKNTPVGSMHVASKLDEAKVIEIRERFAAGELKSHLAASYQITKSQVANIINRVSWRHVT